MCISCKVRKGPVYRRAWYKQFTETGCLCKLKSSGSLLTAEDDVEYRIDLCRVTRGAHIEHLELAKIFFSISVAVNNSIKVGPLVSLLEMFVITENIMKRPVPE
jgi:hypothetical protein